MTRETQITLARKGIVSPEVEHVAKQEGVPAAQLSELVATGQVVITKNKLRQELAPLGIGKKLRVKVNANIGTSRDKLDVGLELKKALVAVEAGADTIMDLSTGGDLRQIRQQIMQKAAVPVGTVPVYEAFARALDSGRSFCHLKADEIFQVIEEHLRQGVDFITVHCGVTFSALEHMRREGRIMDVVSRGGALLMAWMMHTGRENPLYNDFDRLLDLAAATDTVLSLGDGLRPGATADATDRAQITELVTLGQLQSRALERGVQVMIEGPGHVPMDQIQANVLLEKRLCHGAPFYVLGPLVTDRAPGYDHLTGAIGGALAAWAGADFLCYVTPAEHLRLPTLEDVRQGVIASRIAAAAAELARGNAQALEQEKQMSICRRRLDWEGMFRLAIDQKLPRQSRAQVPPTDDSVCSMCGEFCAIKIQKEMKK